VRTVAPETAASIVDKRRAERLNGIALCIACGSRGATLGGGSASQGAQYRILRGGMHLGNLALSRDDHLCRFCQASGKVREHTPV
jgi:hypothetical protein